MRLKDGFCVFWKMNLGSLKYEYLYPGAHLRLMEVPKHLYVCIEKPLNNGHHRTAKFVSCLEVSIFWGKTIQIYRGFENWKAFAKNDVLSLSRNISDSGFIVFNYWRKCWTPNMFLESGVFWEDWLLALPLLPNLQPWKRFSLTQFTWQCQHSL